MRIEKFLNYSPMFVLYVTSEQILGDFQKRLRAEKVHFLQALILTGLFFEGSPVRPSELAATLRSQRSTISHALRDLEKQGWIERNMLAEDARAYTFSLTREGKKKVPRLIRLFDSVQEQIEGAPGGKRLKSHLRLFADIYRGIDFP